MLLEVCCGSYKDALSAINADRIELNSALALGGLTPTLGSLKLIKKNTNLKVICMIRNRAGGFYYHKDDLDEMFADAEIMLKNGADGLAFGFLNKDRTLDLKNTKQMIDLCHKYDKEAVFHRAIDCSLNYEENIDMLVSLGIDRILTSGNKSNAIDGLEILIKIQKKYPNLEILAGCGINLNNVDKIVNTNLIKQVHSSCKNWELDYAIKGDDVNFSYDNNHQNQYEYVDKKIVDKILEKLKD